MRYHTLIGLMSLTILLGCSKSEFSGGSRVHEEIVEAPRVVTVIAPLATPRAEDQIAVTPPSSPASPVPSPIIDALPPAPEEGGPSASDLPIDPAPPRGAVPDDRRTDVNVYHVACTDGADKRTIELSAKADQQVKLIGDLCPNPTARLTILFVVDFSGSMATNDPGAADCGRYKAVTALVDKIKKDIKTGDKVDVGMIGFADAALPVQAAKPIDQFAATTTAAMVCRSDLTGTNYAAAFNLATTTLSTVTTGRTVIYFLSDGLPNRPVDEATGKTAGKVALTALNAAVKGVTTNFVLLDATNALGATGKTYLESLAGDPAKVKIVTDANKLAEKVVELSLQGVSLNEQSSRGELTSDGLAARAVGLLTFRKDTTRVGTWTFETAPFKLNNQGGTPFANDLRIFADEAAGGMSYNTKVTFRFSIK